MPGQKEPLQGKTSQPLSSYNMSPLRIRAPLHLFKCFLKEFCRSTCHIDKRVLVIIVFGVQLDELENCDQQKAP